MEARQRPFLTHQNKEASLVEFKGWQAPFLSQRCLTTMARTTLWEATYKTALASKERDLLSSQARMDWAQTAPLEELDLIKAQLQVKAVGLRELILTALTPNKSWTWSISRFSGSRSLSRRFRTQPGKFKLRILEKISIMAGFSKDLKARLSRQVQKARKFLTAKWTLTIWGKSKRAVRINLKIRTHPTTWGFQALQIATSWSARNKIYFQRG